MSKSTMLLLVGAAFVLVLFGLLGPFWPFELMLGVGGGMFGLGVGVLGTLFGLLVAAIVALFTGPVVLIVTLFALLIALIATVFTVALVALPVLLPLALLFGFIWLLARRPSSSPPLALPAPIRHPAV